MSNPDQSPKTASKGHEAVERRRAGWIKLVVLVVVIVATGALYQRFGEHLSLANLAQHEQRLRTLQREHPLAVYSSALLIYVTVTGLSLPGATALSLLYAWFFGFWRAIVLVSFASTSGATLAFLLSRYLFHDLIQTRFGEQLQGFNRALKREGALYLFSLRVIPAVPFFVINLVMGLTPIRTRTFWWVSQVGMLPGTCVYLFAGSRVPDLQTLAEQGVNSVLSPSQLTQLLVAFGILGVFPLIVKALVSRFRSSPPDNHSS